MYRKILGVMPENPLHAFRLSLEELIYSDPETKGLNKQTAVGMKLHENTIVMTSNYDIEGSNPVLSINNAFIDNQVNHATLHEAGEYIKACMRASFQMGTDASFRFKDLAKEASLARRTLINPLLLAAYLMQGEGRDRGKIPIEKSPKSFENAWHVGTTTTAWGNGGGQASLDKGMLLGRISFLWKIGHQICACHISSDRQATSFSLPVKMPESVVAALVGEPIAKVFSFPAHIPEDVINAIGAMQIKSIEDLANGYRFIFEKTRLVAYCKSEKENEQRLMALAPVYL